MFRMGRVRVFLARLVRQIWFRAAVFTGFGVVIVVLAGVVGTHLPFLGVDVGQASVGSILQILASSMLAVTTFSLAAMVSAYGAATTTATPRATQLLVEDRTSQNALSTFVGSFTFSIVGIVALSTGYFEASGRIVLFAATLAVIVIVVVTLLGWIGHLANFGRMADVIARVEDAAERAVRTFMAAPNLGGASAVPVPDSARAVMAEEVGYVTSLDVAELQAVAAYRQVRIHVVATPGSLADAATPLARVEGKADDSIAEEVRAAFHVDRNRTYEQDPRLGVIALAEIASRALSPAVNDPGTAIQVLGSLHRVFRVLLQPIPEAEPSCPWVFVPRPNLADFVQDGFRPIARDGAGMVEVMVRLRKTLTALSAVAGPKDRAVLEAAILEVNEQAKSVLDKSNRLM